MRKQNLSRMNLKIREGNFHRGQGTRKALGERRLRGLVPLTKILGFNPKKSFKKHLQLKRDCDTMRLYGRLGKDEAVKMRFRSRVSAGMLLTGIGKIEEKTGCSFEKMDAMH